MIKGLVNSRSATTACAGDASIAVDKVIDTAKQNKTSTSQRRRERRSRR